MGTRDYMPTRESLLVPYAANMAAVLAAGPASAYGVTAEAAALLTTRAAALETAYAEATTPATRNTLTIAAKDLARDLCVEAIRIVARQVRACVGLTPEQLLELGLTIVDREPSRVPPPTTKPVLSVIGVDGSIVALRIVDETTPTSLAKVAGSAGAEVLAWCGENPPADFSQWRSMALATRADVRLNFAPEDGGKLVHIVARWYSRRGEFGPYSNAVTTRIVGNITMAA